MMTVNIPPRHSDEPDARPDQHDALRAYGLSDDDVLSQLGIHQANAIMSFMDGARHVVAHVNPAVASSRVDPQITDAVIQSNVKVVAEAPAMAMGSMSFVSTAWGFCSLEYADEAISKATNIMRAPLQNDANTSAR